ncbi:ABC transporter permease [Mesorhizobium sp. INR15]|uniref:ABC transporter permease n=1 Tax=Mesorhizobium sp. INR15 TaxID=2654248 RepID=UPI0018968132|nr:ABC transporter permease [Mesorhizobium sp. INR15]
MMRTDPAVSLAGSAARTARRRFHLPREITAIVALVVLVAAVDFLRPGFADPTNLLSLLVTASFAGMLALGMVFVLAIREIDLSAGWMFHLAAMFAVLLMVDGINPWLAALAGVGLGAGLGLLNGLLVTTLRLPAIIVTLGTYLMFDGLAAVIGKGHALTAVDQSGGFFSIIQGKVFGVVPIVLLVLTAMILAMHVALHRTRFGYRVQAVGSNPEAAIHAGIPVTWTRLQTLVLMGAISGLSGVIYVGFRGGIDAGEGSDFGLLAIVAAIVGGTSISGGHGSVIGAAIGMMIVQVILSGLVLSGVDASWATFVTGALVLLALLLDRLMRWQRAWRAERRQKLRPN